MNYRLIHDGIEVIALIEAVGETSTNAQCFEGTLAQCRAEVARLSLTDPRGVLPAPYELNKYVILERLIARGLGEAFVQVLSSNALTKARWDAAIVLESTNPLFLAAQGQMIPALGVSADTAAQILREGREIP